MKPEKQVEVSKWVVLSPLTGSLRSFCACRLSRLSPGPFPAAPSDTPPSHAGPSVPGQQREGWERGAGERSGQGSCQARFSAEGDEGCEGLCRPAEPAGGFAAPHGASAEGGSEEVSSRLFCVGETPKGAAAPEPSEQMPPGEAPGTPGGEKNTSRQEGPFSEK